MHSLVQILLLSVQTDFYHHLSIGIESEIFYDFTQTSTFVFKHSTGNYTHFWSIFKKVSQLL